MRGPTVNSEAIDDQQFDPGGDEQSTVRGSTVNSEAINDQVNSERVDDQQ